MGWGGGNWLLGDYGNSLRRFLDVWCVLGCFDGRRTLWALMSGMLNWV